MENTNVQVIDAEECVLIKKKELNRLLKVIKDQAAEIRGLKYEVSAALSFDALTPDGLGNNNV